MLRRRPISIVKVAVCTLVVEPCRNIHRFVHFLISRRGTIRVISGHTECPVAEYYYTFMVHSGNILYSGFIHEILIYPGRPVVRQNVGIVREVKIFPPLDQVPDFVALIRNDDDEQ